MGSTRQKTFIAAYHHHDGNRIGAREMLGVAIRASAPVPAVAHHRFRAAASAEAVILMPRQQRNGLRHGAQLIFGYEALRIDWAVFNGLDRFGEVSQIDTAHSGQNRHVLLHSQIDCPVRVGQQRGGFFKAEKGIAYAVTHRHQYLALPDQQHARLCIRKRDRHHIIAAVFRVAVYPVAGEADETARFRFRNIIKAK